VNFDALKDFLSEDEAAPAAGEQLGRYRLVREIARGGTAVVFEAHDPELQRQVAIKILRAGNLERLRHEAAIAARLRHPNIVAVHEVGPNFIVMDYIAGRTLAEAMPELPLDEGLRTLETVARAVDYAHGQGVVHRDLKPANVILQADGQIALTDFGLAKVVGGDDLTLTGAVLGTPHYMAPEQVRGRGFGPSVDVWALGVMLYELVAHRRPFEGDTALAIYDRITRHDPAPLSGPLGAVAGKALAKDPTRRYQSALAFAEELARYRRGARVAAARVWPWLRRKLPALAVSAAVLAGAAGVWIALHARGPRPATAGDGRVEARIADWRAREAVYTAALEHEPGRVAAHLLARSIVRTERAEYATLRGRNAFSDYQAAEEDLTRVLAMEPASAVAHYRRGRLHVQRAIFAVKYGLDPASDLSAAESDLRQAPSLTEARSWLGNLFYFRGVWHTQRHEDARPDFEAAEASLAAEVDQYSLMRRGATRAYLGRFADSERDFTESVRLEPGNVWAWTLWGQARALARDWAGAEAQLTRAIATDPEYSDAWEERGHVRFARGAYRDAAGDYARAIALNPALEPLLGARLREARAAAAR
jgi:tetratricopeptide (TPR) repeat protein/predicted Ser/Thr protein kinase